MSDEVTSNVTTSNNTTPIEGQTQTEQDTVSHETFKKVLAERKADQAKARELEARLNAIEKERQKVEEEKLLSEKNFVEVIARKDKTIEEQQIFIKQKEQLEIDSKKFIAVTKAIPPNADPDIVNFINFKSLEIDSDGEVDKLEAKKLVDDFLTRHSGFILRGAVGMPSSEPRKGGGLTYEQWLNLPAAEMVKREKEVIK